nr:MAG TPA: DNA methyl phosphotriester repair domain protein [Caudoviricetes sp.]
MGYVLCASIGAVAMLSALGWLLPALFMSAFTAASFVAGKADFEKKNSPTVAAIKAAVMVALPALYALFFWFQLGSSIVTAIVGQSDAPSQHVSISDAPVTSGPWGEDETTDETIGSSSRTVYWVPNGKSYHFSRSCPSLSRSDEIERGTLQEARAAGKKDPCNNCAK